jgi:uncharacterized membrane protein YuzA (DUF378 family)
MSHETGQVSERPYALISWLIVSAILHSAFVVPSMFHLASIDIGTVAAWHKNYYLLIGISGVFALVASLGYLILLLNPRRRVTWFSKWSQVLLLFISLCYLAASFEALIIIHYKLRQPLLSSYFAPSGLGLFLLIGQIWALRLAFRHKEAAA